MSLAKCNEHFAAWCTSGGFTDQAGEATRRGVAILIAGERFEP